MLEHLVYMRGDYMHKSKTFIIINLLALCIGICMLYCGISRIRIPPVIMFIFGAALIGIALLTYYLSKK